MSPSSLVPLSLAIQPRSCRNQKTYAPINLDRIQHWIDQGRLTSSPDKPITARELLLSGCVHQVHDGIKLLGNVRVTCPSFLSRP